MIYEFIRTLIRNASEADVPALDWDEQRKNLSMIKERIDDVEIVVRCKDCKYFELDHFKRIYDVPIITAHEICTKWGGGCKTRQDGFCFMGERREP